MQGRYQVYSEDRKRKMVEDAQVADEARKAASDNAALRKTVNPATGQPYLSMAEPDLPGPAAALLMGNAKAAGGAEARLPSQMALVNRRGEIADDRLDKTQAFKRETMAKAQEYAAARMAQAKQNRSDLLAEVRAGRLPMEQFKAMFSEFDALAGQQRQLFGRAEDLWNMGRIGEAQAVMESAQAMDNDLNEMMREMRDARLKLGEAAAPAAGGGAKPWANDPDYLKLSPADKAEWDAQMSGGR